VNIKLPGDLGHARPPATRQKLHNGDGPVDRLYQGAPTNYGAHKRRSYTTFFISTRPTQRLETPRRCRARDLVSC
jgi:hypothetical protein